MDRVEIADRLRRASESEAVGEYTIMSAFDLTRDMDFWELVYTPKSVRALAEAIDPVCCDISVKGSATDICFECSECGYYSDEPGIRFCPHCGRRVLGR